MSAGISSMRKASIHPAASSTSFHQRPPSMKALRYGSGTAGSR